MIRRLRAGVSVLLFFTGAFAQSNEWPSILIPPQPAEPDGDSAAVRLSTDATVFKNYEKTSNGFEWRPASASWKIRQRCLLETSRDATANAMNQFYNFSGSAIKSDVLPRNGSIGLEWTPISRLNLRDSGSSFNTTVDIGPRVQWKVHDIPVLVRGGVSGSKWNDSLPRPITQSEFDSLHGDIGYYGAGAIGDPNLRLFGNPLYVNAEVFGRSINRAGLALVTGSALYAGCIGAGDSLFAYYGDSLSDGKEIPWGLGGGSQRYADAPWRIARSFRTLGALKTKERFGLRPAAIYSYVENSVEYPKLRTMLSNVNVYSHSLTMQLGTREDLPFVYKGGITLGWGEEEWLFGNNLTSAAMSYYKNKAQLDSLSIKLQDHRNNTASSDHSVEASLPYGFSVRYRVSAFRDSKTYPFSYNDNGREVRSYEDNDRITVNHHIGFLSPEYYHLDAEFYGEYSEYLRSFLRKERSAQNFTEKGYRIGLNLGFKPSDRVTIDERIAADAQISDYFYKKAHQDPFDPPSYRRMVTSLCTGRWKINDTWVLNGRWNQSYYDGGSWYGKEYRPPGADSLPSDYYAIENKQTETSVELGLGMARNWIRMESGCKVQDIHAQSFNGQKYIDSPGDKGYTVEPFAVLGVTYRRVSVKARIIRMVRMVNTSAVDGWNVRENWDIRLVGQAAW